MCDTRSLNNWLILTLLMILSAAATVVSAAIANNSWWLAWTAPVAMAAAGVATIAAGFFAGKAKDELTAFKNCAGDRCSGVSRNLDGMITAVIVALGIQASACFSAALIAWIPIAGSIPMGIIAAALAVQVALTTSILLTLPELGRCQRTPSGQNSLAA